MDKTEQIENLQGQTFALLNVVASLALDCSRNDLVDNLCDLQEKVEGSAPDKNFLDGFNEVTKHVLEVLPSG